MECGYDAKLKPVVALLYLSDTYLGIRAPVVPAICSITNVAHRQQTPHRQ